MQCCIVFDWSNKQEKNPAKLSHSARTITITSRLEKIHTSKDKSKGIRKCKRKRQKQKPKRAMSTIIIRIESETMKETYDGVVVL